MPIFTLILLIAFWTISLITSIVMVIEVIRQIKLKNWISVIPALMIIIIFALYDVLMINIYI